MALALTLAICGLAAQGAGASKGVLSFFGSAGSGNGQFSATTGVGGVAVNASGNGVAAGTVYAVDRGNNRVEYFNAAGAYQGQFGSTGAAAGQLSTPEGVAVDQSTGNVYVTDQSNHRVDVFSATGSFQGAFGWGVKSADAAPFSFDFCSTANGGCKAGQLGVGAGEFSISIGYPALAPAGTANAGNVLVADPQNKRVQEFSPTLSAGAVTGVSFVRAFGWGVGGGSGFEICTATCAGGSAIGTAAGQFGTSGPTRVAEDGAGTIYALDNGNFRVQEFTPAGASLTPAVFAGSVLTGTAAASSPVDLALDPSDDDVYVAKAFAAGAGSPPAAAEERRVLRLSAAGSLEETDLAGATINSVNGLALDPASGRLYVSSTTGDQRVYILDSVPAPVVTLGEAGAIGAHAATLNGAITPAAVPLDTSYRFEYSKRGAESWTKVPATEQDIGNGAGEVDVSQPISGLDANQAYEVRLVATTAFAGASTTATGEFTTAQIPPTVSEPGTIGAWWNGPAAVELSGEVNPENLPTTYTFEYGPSAAYGQSTAAVTVAPGATETAISRQLYNLATTTPYHFRLVATNAAGATFGADQTIGSHDESYVYEQVSPTTQKLGHDFTVSRVLPTAPDGDSVGVSAYAGLEQSTNFDGAAGPIYVAHRSASGWTLVATTAPAGLWPGLASEPSLYGYSPDLTRLVACGPADSILNSADTEPYYEGCALREADGSWLAAPVFQAAKALEGNGLKTNSILAASTDLSHVFSAPGGKLLPADTVSTGGSGSASVYEVEGLGTSSTTLRLVNVDNSGSAIGGSNFGLGAGGSRGNQFEAYHAVSDDGQTVYFTATPTAANGFPTSTGVETVFARLDHETTVDVSSPSPAECTACSPTPKAAAYQGASADGSRVFFTTTQQLQNADTDSTTDLYEYDFANSPAQRITQLSAGGPGDLTPGAGAGVQGVVSTSRDGSHVYFVATGLLTSVPNALGQTAAQGADDLYSVDTETATTKFVAELCSGAGASGSQADPACSASDAALWSTQSVNGKTTYRGPAQETPDGRYLVFATNAQLITSGPEADTDNASDVYRYDFDDGDLVRVSIGEPFYPASGNGNTPNMSATIEPRPDSSSGVAGRSAYADDNADDAARAISPDGSTIIFTTPERLQANDLNGAPADTACPAGSAGSTLSMAGCDVYIWRGGDSGGTVSMVSDGQDPAGADAGAQTGSPFGGNLQGQPSLSADGTNVFFDTHTPLVGQDRDTLMDVYDARLGGGIASQTQPAAAVCAGGESCQGPASQGAPATATPASAGFAGPGNESTPPPAKKPRPKKPKKHHGKKHPKRSHKRHQNRAAHNNRGGAR